MKNRYDRLAKNVYSAALAPMADVRPGLETSPDAQVIDLWCEPTRRPLEELGLLGAMVSEPCLLEPYSGTVTLDEARRCVRNQDGLYQELQNKAQSAWKEPPRLWVISTGFPEPVVGLGFEPGRAWPRGFYELPAPWRVGLVVRSELRRDRATLLLRITGTGRVLREAVEDLRREPPVSRLRQLVVRELARLHCEVRIEPGQALPEEEELAMTGEEMLREIEAEARRQEARRMLRLAFEARFGSMSAALDEAVGSLSDPEALERMMRTCLTRERDEVERALLDRVH